MIRRRCSRKDVLAPLCPGRRRGRPLRFLCPRSAAHGALAATDAIEVEGYDLVDALARSRGHTFAMNDLASFYLDADF